MRKTIRRNSKNNPWRNEWREQNKKRVDWRRFFADFLVLTLPIFIASMVFAVLVNTPDVYEYNFKGTQAVEQGRRYVSQEDVLTLIDDFMSGKTDEFVLMEDTDYEPENVFSKEDQLAMTGYRHWANICKLMALITGLLSLALMVLLVLWDRKELLRRNVTIAAIPLLLILLVQFLAKTVMPMMKLCYGRFYSGGFPEGDFLVRIAEESFGRQLATFEAIGCVMVYLVIFYIVARIAGRRQLFSDGGFVEYLKIERL